MTSCRPFDSRGGGKKQTKGNLHYMHCKFSVTSTQDYMEPKTKFQTTRFIKWLKKSKQEAAMKELPPQVGGAGGSCQKSGGLQDRGNNCGEI